MDLFLILKWLHIVSSTILFGTGLGTAFHLWMTWRRGEPTALAVTAKNVVLADWLFTAPSGLVQPASGLALVFLAGYDPFENWLLATYGLYLIAALCWFRVVWLQYRVRDLAGEAVRSGGTLAPECARYMRQWFVLGWPAFVALMAIFFLMVARPF